MNYVDLDLQLHLHPIYRTKIAHLDIIEMDDGSLVFTVSYRLIPARPLFLDLIVAYTHPASFYMVPGISICLGLGF